MAFASLLTLLDDITAVLDDVALMTKMAAKKTAGVVGDDLALNANQVSGVRAERELPVVWAVAKGSLINKIILVPLALVISYFMPTLITPLLMLGGAYLCFEGVEKLWHTIGSGAPPTATHTTSATAPTDEKTKIRGAVRTDFILSAEIIIIALGVVAEMAILPKAVVMALIGVVMALIGVGMTILVYGVVACIVKMDDLGFWLVRQPSSAAQALGQGLILTIPWLMRLLAVAGMVAMFLVGGGIMVHGLSFVQAFLHLHHWDHGVMNLLANLIVGLLTGTAVCAVALPLMAWHDQRTTKPH